MVSVTCDSQLPGIRVGALDLQHRGRLGIARAELIEKTTGKVVLDLTSDDIGTGGERDAPADGPVRFTFGDVSHDPAGMAGDLYITGDAAADELLNTDGTALLIGMLLDQQVPMEWAFTGPATLRQRLGHLDATKIAAMGEDEFVEVIDRTFTMMSEDPQMGPKLREADVPQRFEFRTVADDREREGMNAAELPERLFEVAPGHREVDGCIDAVDLVPLALDRVELERVGR